MCCKIEQLAEFESHDFLEYTVVIALCYENIAVAGFNGIDMMNRWEMQMVAVLDLL